MTFSGNIYERNGDVVTSITSGIIQISASAGELTNCQSLARTESFKTRYCRENKENSSHRRHFPLAEP